MSIIWATRGRTWGFRFLLSGGLNDPLPTYEAVFSRVSFQQEAWMRIGDRVALRLLDPLDRTDQAGRVIPHDFVLSDSDAANIQSVADGRKFIWPQVAEKFARVWDLADPSNG
jgi:hypothetical protein